jgi:4-amino-4-deoxy-L-arabinose transferase-like glycosyltransferase
VTPARGSVQHWRDLALLGLLCAPVFFFRLGDYGIVFQDEAFYHAVAEAMVDSGNWLRIDFRGEHRPYDTFMNAPIQYWVRALLIDAFGSNYWTMRITAATFGAASVLLTWWMLAGWAGRRAAWFAALIQLTTFQLVYLHAARAGVLEPVMAFFFALTAHLFLRGISGRGGFIGHHVCIAVLLNLKLPFAVVPLLAELAVFAVDRDARSRLPRWFATGAAITPLAVGWHAYQAFAVGEPIQGVFGTMAQQGTGDAGFLARRFENGWFYLRTLAYGAFPYSLLLPWAFVSRLRTGVDAQRRTWIVYGLFAACVVAFFTVVSKRYPWYVIPAYPFLCAFIGAWLADVSKRGAVPVWGFAGALAALVWVDVGLDRNPFDRFSWPLDQNLRGLRWLGVQPLIGWAATTGALALMGAAALRRTPDAARRGISLAFATLLLAYGSVRVLVPLRHTDYLSAAESVRRTIDAAALAGLPIRYPVVVPIGAAIGFEARYYFGRDHRIEQLHDERGVRAGYALHRLESGAADRIQSPAP